MVQFQEATKFLDQNLQPMYNDCSGSNLLKKFDIPLSHLDFEYVNTCKNADELEKILQILQSGEEGYYPQLIERTEQKLTEIKPNSKHLRKFEKVLSKNDLEKEKFEEISNDLTKWLTDINLKNEELEEMKNRNRKDLVPEVRKTEQVKLETNRNEKKESNRIKSTDYSAWDKYDVETELLKMDLEEKRMRTEAEKLQNEEKQRSVNKPKVKFNPFLTRAEAIFEAQRENEKANEYFKAKETENSIEHYTNSINYHRNPVTLKNRASAYVNVKKYDEAIEDYKEALKYNETDFECLFHLAQCYYGLKKYHEANVYVENAIFVNPNNDKAQKLAENIRKYIAKDKNLNKNDLKVRMKIANLNEGRNVNDFVNNENRDKFDNINNDKYDDKTKRKNGTKPILKKESKNDKVIVPIPGSSRMPGPYFKVVDRKELSETKKKEPKKSVGFNLNIEPKKIGVKQSVLHKGMKILDQNNVVNDKNNKNLIEEDKYAKKFDMKDINSLVKSKIEDEKSELNKKIIEESNKSDRKQVFNGKGDFSLQEINQNENNLLQNKCLIKSIENDKKVKENIENDEKLKENDKNIKENDKNLKENDKNIKENDKNVKEINIKETNSSINTKIQAELNKKIVKEGNEYDKQQENFSLLEINQSETQNKLLHDKNLIVNNKNVNEINLNEANSVNMKDIELNEKIIKLNEEINKNINKNEETVISSYKENFSVTKINRNEDMKDVLNKEKNNEENKQKICKNSNGNNNLTDGNVTNQEEIEEILIKQEEMNKNVTLTEDLKDEGEPCNENYNKNDENDISSDKESSSATRINQNEEMEDMLNKENDDEENVQEICKNNNVNKNLNDENVRNQEEIEEMLIRQRETNENVTLTEDLKGGGEPCTEINQEIIQEDIHMPYSFIQAWLTARKEDNYEGFATIIRNLNPERLTEVIGNKLDATMLNEMLNCLYRHFTVAHEVEKVYNLLVHLSAVSRFNIITMFLTKDDKTLLQNLFNFLRQHGKHVSKNILERYSLC